MSITDELREWMDRTTTRFDGRRYLLGTDEELTAIADRIDAEYQITEDEWMAKNGDMWLKGYAECHEELMEGHPVIAESLEKAGWVKLPVDADGEYIHAGDVLDGYGKTIEVVELRYGRSGWVLISKDGNGYADTFAFVHHHEPTVDELLDQLEGLRGNGADYEDVVTRASEIAEKLRELLKEDA